MLKSYMNSVPLPKLIIIEDTLHAKGQNILEYLLQLHLELEKNTIYYCVFQETFKKVQNAFTHKKDSYGSKIVLYDCITNSNQWNETDRGKSQNLYDIVKQLGKSNVIVFIDSLANAIHQYGLAETYRIINELKGLYGVHQIVTILHLDLLENPSETSRMFSHLSTLNITLLPKSSLLRQRVNYTFKKSGKKIINEIEEYYFEGGNFISEQIEKFDPKKFLEKSFQPQVNPEMLTTFKIGLTEKDKESRDQLVLPYLPKEDLSGPGSGGKIIYEFDEQDDWDEEDPDDDLDI